MVINPFVRQGARKSTYKAAMAEYIVLQTFARNGVFVIKDEIISMDVRAAKYDLMAKRIAPYSGPKPVEVTFTDNAEAE